MVKAAPMISRRVAVENKPTLDFMETDFNVRLANRAETTRKAHSIASTKNPAPTRGNNVPDGTCAGFTPLKFESVDQLPFQAGYNAEITFFTIDVSKTM